MNKEEPGKGSNNPKPNSNPTDKPSPNPSSNNDEIKIYEIKQCIGCLYYSSIVKAESRNNPTCIGIPRSKAYQVPTSLIRKYDLESTKINLANLKEFKYACVGHAKYLKRKDSAGNPEKISQMANCAGFEVYILKTPPVDLASVNARRVKEGLAPLPARTQPRQSRSDEYLSRFTRNANLVAAGVAKNLKKAGQHVKESLYEILNGRSK